MQRNFSILHQYVHKLNNSVQYVPYLYSNITFIKNVHEEYCDLTISNC